MRRYLIKSIALLLTTGLICFVSAPYLFGKDGDASLLNPAAWKVLDDSGWPGKSTGYIDLDKSQEGVRFIYRLAATRLWPWPEIDFYKEFQTVKDVSEYSGIRLHIKGKRNEEAYFYFLSNDAALGLDKPCHYRIRFNGEYQRIFLPFSQFKISKDWMLRNPGFNPSIEWNNIKTIGFHKKGMDGEKGEIELTGIEFLHMNGQQAFNLETARSLPPKHFFIDPKLNISGSTGAKAIVYNIEPSEAKKISPYLFGANQGVWLDFPDSRKVTPLGLKIVRAGGPFMDRYNWRSSKYTFPGNKKALLMRRLDDFIGYCRQIGAEPLIQINALGYAPDEKDRFRRYAGPENAAALIRYLNGEKGYNIRFFEIGNEPFIWHNVHFDVRDKPCSVDEYFEIFKSISMAIKKTQKAIDPDLDVKVFGPGISTSYLDWKTLSAEDNNVNAMRSFLRKCRQYQNNRSANPKGFRILDVLSFHLFPSFRDADTGEIEEDQSSILRSTQNWWDRDYINRYDLSFPLGQKHAALPDINEWIEEDYPGTELAVTEFNIDSESMVGYDPVIKVLYLADLYGIMAKNGVNYATQFCLNSSDQNAALIDDTDNVTALYYPLALYANHFKGILLDAETTLPERLNLYACKDGDKIVLMVVNKDDKPCVVEIVLKDKKTEKRQMSFSHTFPPLSITCIKVPEVESRNPVECWEYGSAQIDGTIDSNTSL